MKQHYHKGNSGMQNYHIGKNNRFRYMEMIEDEGKKVENKLSEKPFILQSIQDYGKKKGGK